MSEHVEFRDRIHRTLYYGQYSDRSLPSLAVTGKSRPKDKEIFYFLQVVFLCSIIFCVDVRLILYFSGIRTRRCRC